MTRVKCAGTGIESGIWNYCFNSTNKFFRWKIVILLTFLAKFKCIAFVKQFLNFCLTLCMFLFLLNIISEYDMVDLRCLLIESYYDLQFNQSDHILQCFFILCGYSYKFFDFMKFYHRGENSQFLNLISTLTFFSVISDNKPFRWSWIWQNWRFDFMPRSYYLILNCAFVYVYEILLHWVHLFDIYFYHHLQHCMTCNQTTIPYSPEI